MKTTELVRVWRMWAKIIVTVFILFLSWNLMKGSEADKNIAIGLIGVEVGYWLR